MAQILAPGETLANGEVRTEETFRFHLAFQPDGNLVVYAYLIAPNPHRQAIGATDTNGLGSNIHLRMNPGGWLEMLDNGTGQTKWYRPIIYTPNTGFRPYGVPNSTLHLQADGRLVIYKPDFSGATWAIAGVSQPTEDVCVIPGALILDVSDGGTIASQFNKQVVNDTPGMIGVRDGHNFVALPPGGQVGVATPGTLGVAATVYDFSATGGPGSSDAVAARRYGPAETVIHATGSSGAGFGLA